MIKLFWIIFRNYECFDFFFHVIIFIFNSFNFLFIFVFLISIAIVFASIIKLIHVVFIKFFFRFVLIFFDFRRNVYSKSIVWLFFLKVILINIIRFIRISNCIDINLVEIFSVTLINFVDKKLWQNRFELVISN